MFDCELKQRVHLGYFPTLLLLAIGQFHSALFKTHLKHILLHQDDDLKDIPGAEGHLLVDLLLAPALFLQAVAHDAQGLLLEPGVEVEGYVRPGLHTASTLEVHLEPGEQSLVGHTWPSCIGDLCCIKVVFQGALLELFSFRFRDFS